MQFIKCVSMCTIFHMQALEKERNELKERNRDRKHFEHWTLSHWKRKTHKESAKLNEWIGLYVFYINFCVERFEVSDNRRHTIWLHPQWFFHYSFYLLFIFVVAALRLPCRNVASHCCCYCFVSFGFLFISDKEQKYFKKRIPFERRRWQNTDSNSNTW